MPSPIRRHLRALALAATACLMLPAAQAQSPAWPQRPVRLVVPYGPGSSPDVMARILAERLTPRLGQPVLVENRAGAGGNVGTGAVAKAAPDGHTLVISTNGPLVNNTVLYSRLPYDPFRELAPVVLAGGQANVCAVRADAGIGSMKELVAAMRARPGGFNFSSIGVGSLSHLGVELLKVRTGSFAVHIPYPSSPAAITAVLQGDVQFSCVPAVAVMPQVRAGRLKALAVSTGARSALMPEVPTLKEAGFPDVEAVAWMAILAPAGTPAEVIGRLNREINAVLALPDVRERMHSQYMEPIGGSPEQLARFMQDELRVWTPIIRRSGATIE
ncbi:MAG: tripartite tricarboxylate transporter substrate binding protein [Betaproteobacteria bacterium]|nr:tripartite tricarboxylate transporter substrate binding protein [Betaproteobacteria bacterium]